MNNFREFANDPVELAVLQYLHEVETGATPDVDSLGRELPPESRTQLVEILGAIGWARDQFPSPFRPSHVVAGRYELRNEIGAGGFGKVWRAYDQRVEKEVAIKFVDLLTKSSLEAQRLFEAERRALARVDRPGIARILDHGQDEDRLFLVMDLVAGQPLSKVLAALERKCGAGGVPSTDTLRRAIGAPCPSGGEDLTDDKSWFRVAARVVASMLRTLEAVHAAGVLHRDIKPSNIVLQGGGQPVLLDFGMAALQDERKGKVTECLVGTLPYLAPEQVRQHRTGSDARTDVYQVGLVLYELFTLMPAFDPRQEIGLMELVREGRFVRPRRVCHVVPRELEDICLRALETHPDRRYPSALAFREDLDRWISGVAPPLASRGGRAAAAVRNTRYFVRRHRAASLALGGVAIGALAVALWLGGGAHVELVECTLRDASSAVATVAASTDQQVFAMLVSENPERGTTAYQPLQVETPQPGATDRMSGWVATGSNRVTLRTLDGRPLEVEGYPQRRIQLFATAEVDRADALRGAFEDLWNQLTDSPAVAGVSRRDALRILEALDLPSRTSTVGPGSPMAPERILEGGQWSNRGIAASTLPLGPPGK